jgi:superfamily II DNA or RNA helicase
MSHPIKLRPYQKTAINTVVGGFHKHKTQLLVAATGAGKTVIFSEIAGMGKGKILVLAHRSELIDQAAETMASLSGRSTSIEQGTRQADRGAEIIVASVQTLQGERLATWPTDHFSLIICDEAHHAVSASWQTVVNHFGTAKVLGVTATPSRADGRKLGNYFERVAYEIGLRKLIELGFLSPLTWLPLKISFDIRKVRVSKGKLNDDDLGEAIEPGIQSVLDSIIEHARGRRILAFLPLIKTSKEFVARCNERGIRAAHVDGKMSAEERDSIKRRLAAGKLDLVSNSMVWTEGFDCPEVDCILSLRPTKSVALMQQLYGRGTRLSPHTGKQDLLILDFLFEHENFEAISPACLIAGSDDLARAMVAGVERGKTVDLFTAEAEAEKTLESFLVEIFDPKKSRGLLRYSDALSLLGEGDLVGFKFSRPWELGTPTEGQLEAIRKAGIDPNTVTHTGEAKVILDAVGERRGRGLATLKQVVCLYQTKHPCPLKATFEEAGKWLDGIYGRT